MIGIIILNYRSWDETKRCIESITANPPKEAYQIYLIDNASPNKPEYDLQQLIKQHAVYYTKNEKNLGYNGGNNVGIKKALADGCDAILITNNDVCFQKGSIQSLYRYTQKHPEVGIVGPKILDREGKVQKSNLCQRTGLKEKYLVRTRLHAIFRKRYGKYFGFDRDYDTTFNVFAVLGCCFLMTRACAEKVTPLDEYPFLYEEELMLGIRMEDAGFQTVYHGESVIEHLHGGSTQHVKAFSYGHNIRSEIYYCQEYLHAKKWQIYPLYMYRVFLYIVRCVKYEDFRKNWRWFHKMVKMELKKR